MPAFPAYLANGLEKVSNPDCRDSAIYFSRIRWGSLSAFSSLFCYPDNTLEKIFRGP
jgi:hypothetical protein